MDASYLFHHQNKILGINCIHFLAPKLLIYQLSAALSLVLGHQTLLVIIIPSQGSLNYSSLSTLYKLSIFIAQMSIKIRLVFSLFWCVVINQLTGVTYVGASAGAAVASDKRIIISTQRGKTVVMARSLFGFLNFV